MLDMPSKAALLLIDIQLGFNDTASWGARSTPDFEKNIADLLEAFRAAHLPIFHIAHHSISPSSALHPSKEGVGFQPYAAPLASEPVFTKNVNSAFIGTNLEEELRQLELECLVVCGLTTDHCVSTSVRMAANLGVVKNFDKNGVVDGQPMGRILLLSDATATHSRMFGEVEYEAETMHAVSLASLHGEFCDVMTTEELLAILPQYQIARR